jgi:hypothetical protein
MSWFMTADTRGFLDTAGDFLRADPARNTVMLTVTEDLRVAAASAGDPVRLVAAGRRGSVWATTRSRIA